MECRLIRITADDHQKYSDIYSKTEYSFFEKGHSLPPFARMMMKAAILSNTLSQSKFIETINTPGHEMYLFETDGQVNGFTYIIYKNKYCCDIVEFMVVSKDIKAPYTRPVLPLTNSAISGFFF